MIKKRNILFCVLLTSLAFQGAANSLPTRWEKVTVTLEQLLNSGWQISGHSSNRVAANSNAGAGFDRETYTFILTKGGKYIICATENPTLGTTEMGCRRLN
jgi:hypothetical protein